ncbi:MAG TPA: hypothetical protein VFU32_10555 [Ktedonobacterales bacterium]|nr:hypothetical protein [Ktedonobacterales bacterium]
MSEELLQTEIPGGPRWRKRVRMIALAVLGLCVLCLMVGIGLLSLGTFLLPGILAMALFVVFLFLGIYLNAASRLIRYTDGSTQWEWERKK